MWLIFDELPVYALLLWLLWLILLLLLPCPQHFTRHSSQRHNPHIRLWHNNFLSQTESVWDTVRDMNQNNSARLLRKTFHLTVTRRVQNIFLPSFYWPWRGWIELPLFHVKRAISFVQNNESIPELEQWKALSSDNFHIGHEITPNQLPVLAVLRISNIICLQQSNKICIG